MKIQNQGNPPLTEETLAHYGVLGMKWGRTRARANANQIRSARRRLSTERKKINRAEDKAFAINDRKKRDKAMNQVAKMQKEALKNPDRVIAARMTRGEKIATVVLFGPAAPLSIAAIAGSSAYSRRIERMQETGAYNKKK